MKQTYPDERKKLRQEMKLLLERSKQAKNNELPGLALAMCEIYKTLYWQPISARSGG